MSKVFKNSGSERPAEPVETPALAGSLKQESYHFSGEKFKSDLKITKEWAMPNGNTFTIKPIKRLVEREVNK